VDEWEKDYEYHPNANEYFHKTHRIHASDLLEWFEVE
jgi:hypothetical protein